MYEAFREFDVTDGKAVISSGEIRYQFTVIPGRKAVTWANACEGFSPAEDATIELHEVAIRLHQSHPWRVLNHTAFDAFSADVPDEWFFSQLENEDA